MSHLRSHELRERNLRNCFVYVLVSSTQLKRGARRVTHRGLFVPLWKGVSKSVPATTQVKQMPLYLKHTHKLSWRSKIKICGLFNGHAWAGRAPFRSSGRCLGNLCSSLPGGREICDNTDRGQGVHDTKRTSVLEDQRHSSVGAHRAASVGDLR